mmetsp:Transcript_3251/g.5397  ORF Transcript_3251/g.5397 Transcript_3251/m.5397 type:complete len:157 (-) Transcript_3251:710-1180(-)
MSKLEHIYNCCTREIQITLDQFWAHHDVPSKKLSVDVDNLQSLIVYFISRMKGCAQIVTNLSIIENFIPDAVQMSNRAYYLAMMQSSCEYLLNLHEELTKEDVEQSKIQKIDVSMANIERIKQQQIQRRLLIDSEKSNDSFANNLRTSPSGLYPSN